MIFHHPVYGMVMKVADRGLFMEVRLIAADFSPRRVAVGGLETSVLTVGKAACREIA